jgi:hypothetical protein
MPVFVLVGPSAVTTALGMSASVTGDVTQEQAEDTAKKMGQGTKLYEATLIATVGETKTELERPGEAAKNTASEGSAPVRPPLQDVVDRTTKAAIGTPDPNSPGNPTSYTPKQ